MSCVYASSRSLCVAAQSTATCTTAPLPQEAVLLRPSIHVESMHDFGSLSEPYATPNNYGHLALMRHRFAHPFPLLGSLEKLSRTAVVVQALTMLQHRSSMSWLLWGAASYMHAIRAAATFRALIPAGIFMISVKSVGSLCLLIDQFTRNWNLSHCVALSRPLARDPEAIQQLSSVWSAEVMQRRRLSGPWSSTMCHELCNTPLVVWSRSASFARVALSL